MTERALYDIFHFILTLSYMCKKAGILISLPNEKKYIALVSVLMHMVYTCSLILKKMIESLEIFKVISREMRNYPLSLPC